jgi:DNA-binding NarL/FixJ family response regulator
MKQDGLVSSPGESYLAQAHVQDCGEAVNAHDSFVVSGYAQLPMVQVYRIPATNFCGLLTPREMEVLGCLGMGLSVKGAARELAISPGTVKWHVKNIYYKLGASSREDALLKARIRGII